MGTTHYIWDELSDNVLQETDEADTTTVEYTCEPRVFGSVLSQRRDGHTYTHHYDALGSTRELIDESETATDTYDYDAWGNQIASSGTTENPYRFCGKHGYSTHLNSGEIYVRTRYYQSPIGRWTAVDPLRFADGMNRYEYVASSPAMHIDPSGLSTCNKLTPSIPVFPDGEGVCVRFTTSETKWIPTDWFPTKMTGVTINAPTPGVKWALVADLTCVYTRVRKGCYTCEPCCFHTAVAAKLFNNRSRLDLGQGGVSTVKLKQTQPIFSVLVEIKPGDFLTGPILGPVVDWLTKQSLKFRKWPNGSGPTSEKAKARKYCPKAPKTIQPDPLPNLYHCNDGDDDE